MEENRAGKRNRQETGPIFRRHLVFLSVFRPKSCSHPKGRGPNIQVVGSFALPPGAFDAKPLASNASNATLDLGLAPKTRAALVQTPKE